MEDEQSHLQAYLRKGTYNPNCGSVLFSVTEG